MRPISDTNLKRICKYIRSSAAAERFQGNSASWYVWVKGENPDHPIMAGWIDDSGYHVSFEHYKEKY